LNSFKALVSGSPLTPANFGQMYGSQQLKSSNGQRPPALIQGKQIFYSFLPYFSFKCTSDFEPDFLESTLKTFFKRIFY
jgi:hypothetical protein